jgi:hypothetical protein
VSAKKTDISQIRKYLNGELDAHAMHQLERQAQDDPFLMDAMDGYEEATGLQQRNLDDLNNRLQQRIDQNKTRQLIPWKYYAAAASILIVFSLGYLLRPAGQQTPKKEIAAVTPLPKVDHPTQAPDTITPPINKATEYAKQVPPVAGRQQVAQIRAAAPVSEADVRVTKSAGILSDKKIDSLIKAYPGWEVKPNGEVIAHVVDPVSIRLNGKDYYPNDRANTMVTQQSEKAEVKNDYVSKVSPDTVLYSAAPYKARKADSVTLKEVTIGNYAKLNRKREATTNSQVLLGKVDGVQVTTPDHISGRVMDELGVPLPGVNVQVLGRPKATQTDANGFFSLPAKDAETINLNYVGYASRRLTARPTDSLNIALKPAENALSEVMVTGYGTIKKTEKGAHPQMDWDGYNKYLNRAVTIDGKTGTVQLSFIVGAKGELGDFKIIKSLSRANDNEAIDMIKTGPAWAGDVSGQPKTIKLKITFRKE